MLVDRTVFILGAGASVPFGFPTGSQLIREILALRKDRVPDLMDGMRCESIFDHLKIDQAHLNGFLQVLRHSQVDSIDELLAQPHYERYTELGRFLIAASLIRKENAESVLELGSGPNQNWYRILWRHLRDYGSMETLLSNANVTFVTFNYDRSLEHYLWTTLRMYFRARSHDVRDFLSGSIFHVHGQLGAYPGLVRGVNRPYAPSVGDLEDISRAMQGIRVIHEVSDYPHSNDIRSRIAEADRLIFLGCQYHRDNLMKLFSEISRYNTDIKIMGTSFGLSPAECDAARKRIARLMDMPADNIDIGNGSNLGCYDFLREKLYFY